MRDTDSTEGVEVEASNVTRAHEGDPKGRSGQIDLRVQGSETGAAFPRETREPVAQPLPPSKTGAMTGEWMRLRRRRSPAWPVLRSSNRNSRLKDFMRVLITDGNERAALAVARALVATGFEVYVAASTRLSLAGVS